MGSITSAMCYSFKEELFEGLHNFNSNTFKVALIVASPTGTFDGAITNYSQLGADEVTGTGYSAGGLTLTPTVGLYSGTGTVDFVDVSWTSSTITAGGALIYNATNGNRAVAVLSFAGPQQDTNGTFTLDFPAPGAGTSSLRIS